MRNATNSKKPVADLTSEADMATDMAMDMGMDMGILMANLISDADVYCNILNMKTNE